MTTTDLFDQARALCDESDDAITGWDYVADAGGYLTMLRLNFADNTYVLAFLESGPDGEPAGYTWTRYEPSNTIGMDDIPWGTDGGTDPAMFSDDMRTIAAGIRRTVWDAKMLADEIERLIPDADRNTRPVNGGWTLTIGGCSLTIWDDPDAEKHDITCELEGANLAAEAPDPDADHLLVMTWNLERNYELDAEIAAFADGTIPVPDVLLASEVDRGCDRSDGVDGGWELAEAVGLNYVFGVEFVEGARPEGAQDALSAPCEHGQAIFSRYPIGNVELFRHVNTGTDRWDDPDEPRIGTRADLEADIAVGDRLVHVVSVHYDDQVTEAETAARAGQARVTAERGLDHDIPTVVGGDMNTAFYLMDATPTAARAPAAKAFWDLGWHDTHVGIADRVTAPRELAGSEVNAIVDLLWVRDPATVSEQGWCDPADCAAISDHLPQWFRWELPSA